ncbi:MAG TPA: multiheme c-type cytochrome, partial [Gammaproteobacteria bacterium]|nr:multiheme c-type cytochrome [Gammaproteobacteria bacterium]
MTQPNYARIATATVVAALAACSGGEQPAATGTPARERGDSDVGATLQYAGVERCAECHAQQAADWSRSHHARAMAPAEAQTVLGEFNGDRFDYGENFAEFFTRDGEYWLRTNDLPRWPGPADENSSGDVPGVVVPSDGVVELQIRYTFGFEPLQQYLVET